MNPNHKFFLQLPVHNMFYKLEQKKSQKPSE